MLKKITIAVAMTGLMAGMAYAGASATQGINGSKHDMNRFAENSVGGTGVKDVYGRTCVFCHTPHNATPDTNGPLWNRTTTGTALGSYVWIAPLNSNNSQLKIANDPLVGPSRLCQTCHDGVTAADSHASNGTQTGVKKITGSTVIDLSITHPIGFDYDKAAAGVSATANTGGRGAGEIRPSSSFYLKSATYGAGAGFDTHAPSDFTTKKISDTLFNDGNGKIMTCATCHEVHNTTNVAPSANPGGTANFFLNSDEAGSAICLSCHVK